MSLQINLLMVALREVVAIVSDPTVASMGENNAAGCTC